MSTLLEKLNIPFERFTLDNGLVVIVHEDRKAPVVAVNLWYRVGAKDEPEGMTGFAHLFEHLMCGGSKHLPGSILTQMSRIGATEVNATTGYDRTNYFETVPTGALDFALFAESDRMGHFLISEDTLELQRGVVLNEKRQREGQPYGLVGERLYHASYPAGHPYAHTVIGSERDIQSATLENVRNWFRTYYGPSNAVLALVGDIDVATAREKVQKYFGDIPPGPPLPRPGAWAAKRRGTKRETLEDRVPATLVQISWNIAESGQGDEILIDLAARILGSGRGSRLHNELVLRRGLATEAVCHVAHGLIGGMLLISLVLRDGVDPKEAEQAAMSVVQEFIGSGPSELELKRTVTKGETDLVRRLATVGVVADLLASNEVYHRDPGYYRIEMARAASASARDVQDACARWLDDGAYTLTVEPYRSRAAVIEQPVDRSVPPAVDTAMRLQLPKLQEATLSNGVRVLLAERHELPMVECKLLIKGGGLLEPSDSPGLAKAAMTMMGNGSGAFSGAEFTEQCEQIGMAVGAGCSHDYANAGMSALSGRIDESMSLFADFVLRPRMAQDDLTRVKHELIQGIAQRLSSPDACVGLMMPELMYGAGHPYARRELPADIEKIAREDVVRMHASLFDPSDAIFIVVGDTTLAQMLPLLEAKFGSWQSSRTEMARQSSMVRGSVPGTVHVIDYPGVPQSTIAAVLRAPAFDVLSENARAAVNFVVGGNFSSRVNMNLREEKHWTYGVGSGFRDFSDERLFVLQTSVQKDRTLASVAEILRELRELTGERLLQSDELEAMRSASVLSAPAMLQTMGGLLQAIEVMITRGLPMNYWEGYIESLQAMTLEAVRREANQLIRVDDIVWIVAGDLSSLGDLPSAIRALGLTGPAVIEPWTRRT
ncbi:M16 family metallopeptidase [Peristeroidobacter soli]|uniref:M16 family metallopeptidase n=1 Tax=Peristeroidobacter soli TaxID=2497877 RepID=UPI00101D488A|nr:pitrilysin family protein [Peristeroidobacter soli]